MTATYRVAKVNFDLISTDYNASEDFYFKTYIKNLIVGQQVWVISKGNKVMANFLGYEDTECEPYSKIVRRVSKVELEVYKALVEKNLLECPLKITEEALDDYRNNFRGNQRTSKEQASLKLTRNVLMSYKKHTQRNGVLTFQYGLQLIKVKGHTVIGVEKAVRAKDFTKDWNRYMYLNNTLGIELSHEDKIRFGIAV